MFSKSIRFAIVLLLILLPAREAAALAPCATPYTVRAGDTLTRIARNCGPTVAQLQSANRLNGDLIFVGQQLVIPGASAQSAKVIDPKVVIVVVDGWRYEDTYGGSGRQNIPQVWNDLRPLGLWYSRVYNDGVTLTAAGHAAILSGAWQPIANDGTGRPTKPTMFEYYRRFTGAPITDTALVHNGDADGKAGRWAYSTAPGYGEAYAARQYNNPDGSDFDDAGVYNLAVSALAQHPRLVLIAFPGVDEWAHTGSFENYLQAIRTVDALIWRLWNALQADPFYAGQTTYFVTNDHGRQLDDFTTHGGGTESERHVTLLIVGPRAPISAMSSARRALRDIAPTVGRLMNFPTPLAQGRILWEAIR